MAKFPRALGIALPLTWREQQERGDLPGFTGDLYAFLRRAGYGYVEFGTDALVDDQPRALLRREAALCRQAGLGVAMHPYLGGDHNCAHFGKTDESEQALCCILQTASEAARQSSSAVTVNLHPAEAAYEPRRDWPAEVRRCLLGRSRRFFAAAAERIADEPHVRVVVEHQVPPGNGEAIMRIGDTWRELLQVVAETPLEVCWDTGHYILSCRRHGQAEQPPQEFLERVGHVHLHDVRNGRDHCPVRVDSERIRHYVLALRRRGYRAGLTLEYAREAMSEEGGFDAVAANAPAVLLAWMREAE